jgi:hypothetical protein
MIRTMRFTSALRRLLRMHAGRRNDESWGGDGRRDHRVDDCFACGSAPATGAAGTSRVTIAVIAKTDENGQKSTSFTLSAATRSDSGTLWWRHIVLAPKTTSDGLRFTPIRRTDTLNGKHGTLVIRSVSREFPFGRKDDAVWTGRWTIVSGTGDYANLKGSGAVVGISRARPRDNAYTERDVSYRYEGMWTTR